MRLRVGERGFLSVTQLQVWQVPDWLSYGRFARFDTGACNLRVGVGSTGFHKPGPPGATPGPATAEYANRQSGHVESVAILQVRLLPRSLR